MEKFSVRTSGRAQFINIDREINRIIAGSGVRAGACRVFVPHTTAALTINENADPDVVHDLLLTLEELIPQHRQGYRHGEGNSDAHVKASLFGPSLSLIFEHGKLCLGVWQAIYFCEFDGPRNRRLMVHIS